MFMFCTKRKIPFVQRKTSRFAVSKRATGHTWRIVSWPRVSWYDISVMLAKERTISYPDISLDPVWGILRIVRGVLGEMFRISGMFTDFSQKQCGKVYAPFHGRRKKNYPQKHENESSQIFFTRFQQLLQKILRIFVVLVGGGRVRTWGIWAEDIRLITSQNQNLGMFGWISERKRKKQNKIETESVWKHTQISQQFLILLALLTFSEIYKKTKH